MLIGATTENPFFEVNAPLISRSRVVELHPLTDDDVREIVQRALADPRAGTRRSRSASTPDAEDAVVMTAGGDARVALNTLEQAAAEAGEERARRPGCARPTRRRAHPALRQARRRPLRRHLRLHQVDARLRSRRRGLLAGAHGPRRRGSEVHRATHPDLRQRGRRQRGPAGPARRRGGVQGGGVDRMARVPHQPLPGGHLHGARAEEQRLVPGDRRRADRGTRWRRRARCPIICATATGRVRTPTARIATRTSSPMAGSISATCPTDSSGGPSSSPEPRGGRPSARPPAVA